MYEKIDSKLLHCYILLYHVSISNVIQNLSILKLILFKRMFFVITKLIHNVNRVNKKIPKYE